MATLSYKETGEGRDIVFIHGFCESKRIWDAFEAILATRYRVISVDLPGFGKTPVGSKAQSLEDFARQLKATLEALEAPEPVLIGHSLGGYVALAYAQLFPGHLSGLGLFHSTSFADSEEKKHKRNQAISIVKQHGSARYVESLFPGLFTQKSRDTMQQQIQYFIKEASETSSQAIMQTLAAMRDRPDRRDLLPRLKVPVMFIAGKGDTLLPVEQVLQECHLPKDAHVYFLEDVGHIGMIEAKVRTLRMVKHFVSYCYHMEEESR